MNLDKTFYIDKWKRKYKCSPWAPSLLFHWGVEKVGMRYNTAAKYLNEINNQNTVFMNEKNS